MMRGWLYLIIILFAGLASCSKSSSSGESASGGSSDGSSGVFKHAGDAHFKFTNRGVEYDARSNGKEKPLNNVAILQYNPEVGNRLDINAFDADVSPHQSFRTGLVITVFLGDMEMKKGSYRFVSDKELIDCEERGYEGCSPIANGTIVPYTAHRDEDGYHDSEYTLTNALNSVSGELEITEFRIGKFTGGFAEGTISGKFFFDGFALGETNPGSASGKFENVKVVAQKR